MAGLIAEGTLYSNRMIDGVEQGWKKIPGLAKFEVAPEVDIIEQTSKDKGKYGQVVASVGLPSTTGLSISIKDVDGEALAMALMGDIAPLSIAGGSVTDESITSKLGSYVMLPQQNITASTVVLTSDPAGTTYVEGTDYKVNYDLGMVEFLASGSIPDATALLIDYDHGGVAGTQISGSTAYEVRGALKLDGRNLNTGKDLIVNVDEAILATDGAVDLMSDEFVELGLTGKMITQTGASQPYTVQYELTKS